MVGSYREKLSAPQTNYECFYCGTEKHGSEDNMALKGSLTKEEVIKAAYLYFIMGTEQHELSIAFSVNPGRISEACTVIGNAAENVADKYRNLLVSKEKPKTITEET
jgi:hypothetical protein